MLTALFGGTFDPIHNGHLLPVISLAKELNLAQINLLPNNIPPHKAQPIASLNQRLTMLKLAINDLPLFSLDKREIEATNLNKPSYTIDTLKEWRNENGKLASLAFIIGQDSLLNLPSWHQWQHLTDYCHLIICRRPDYVRQTNNYALEAWINERICDDKQVLHNKPNGYVYFANTQLMAISSTQIRHLISQQQDVTNFLPALVKDYILQQKLYQTKKC